jgi:hypothetical protein
VPENFDRLIVARRTILPLQPLARIPLDFFVGRLLSLNFPSFVRCFEDADHRPDAQSYDDEGHPRSDFPE